MVEFLQGRCGDDRVADWWEQRGKSVPDDGANPT
jgi:hypothetical protein